jgi:ADP-ribosylglycohydrolase
MIGAIIGDIVGSRFEFHNNKSKEFELFTDKCFVTDDSVMTLAVAKAIMEARKTGGSFLRHLDDLREFAVKYMQEIGRKYPNCGYGKQFASWVFSKKPKPYNSFGNGAAMRVSPAGFAAGGRTEAIESASAVTKVTHNHKEGIKGAEATTVAIFMARSGASKAEIRERIHADYYPLDFRVDDIRDSYRFDETCQGTVPQAIEAFLESTSFEDAIRTAISLGGDSDTLAAITGGIAEAHYGVPEDIRARALEYLDDELRAIYDEWTAFAANENRFLSGFEALTQYIEKISETTSFGEWCSHDVLFPWVNYGEVARSFINTFYRFHENHHEYGLGNYFGILKEHGIKDNIRAADVNSLDAQGVLALIMFAIRADRFCDGALLCDFKCGNILQWLKRLKSIDDETSSRRER